MAMLLLAFVGMLTTCADLPPGPGTEKPDTTSHNFTWQTFTLGDGNSSVLYDVAVINDTLAYAVGAIYLQDSAGQFDPLPYNIAKWNGANWDLQRITVPYRGYLITPRLNAIFVVSASDIWLSSGVPIRGDGQQWRQYHLFDMGVLTQSDGSINKIWAGQWDAYFVGNKGTIVRYNGSWQKLSSGTRVTINDVWGVHNSLTGERLVLCAASNKFDPGERKILRIGQQNSVDTIAWSPQRRIHSIWFDRSSALYTAGGGVFVRKENQDWSEITEIPLIFTNRIRGVGENDVFVVGDFGLVAHFNGASWHVYADAPRALYHSLNYKRDLVIAVGERNAQAVILMGKRQKGD